VYDSSGEGRAASREPIDGGSPRADIRLSQRHGENQAREREFSFYLFGN
jgi:hypothetical protein